MFNERATYRLHHPVRSIPELVVAANGAPDTALAERVIKAFQGVARVDAGPVWEVLVRDKQGNLETWLEHGSVHELSQDLSCLGRSEAAQGFFGGAGQHAKCERDPAFAKLLAAWIYDKLLSLAEAVGVVRLELPETGPWGETLKLSPVELWNRIEGKLGIELSPPDHVGGCLGIRAGDNIIQMRVLEAIYAAFRLRQLSEQRGFKSVCELGAGAGLTAYYAILLGVEEYTIIDLPTMNAVQGYMLGGSRIGDHVALRGEESHGKRVHILPPEAFSSLPLKAFELLYNQDSLPEIEHEAAISYLRDAARLNIPIILSINQEAHLPTVDGYQASVPELIAEAGGYGLSSRHRHWLREGYLEEIYELR